MMSKRIRGIVLLAVLGAVLLGVVLIVNSVTPNTTAGVRDVVNRDDDYYKVIVIQTMTAQAETPK